MEQGENPKVRWLDVVPTTHEGAEVYVVRDPEGITDKSLVVSRDVLCLLALMDGSRGTRDIQDEFVRRWGTVMQPERIHLVIQTMDEHFFLANDRYRSHIDSLRREYMVAPFREACLSGRSYPNDGEELKRLMSRVMGLTPEPREKHSVKGMIVPHIDYQRGAEVYAPTYHHLPRNENTLFIIFGTCHKWAPKLWNIAYRDLRTPLGMVRKPEGICRRIAEHTLLRDYMDEWPHRNEHSIELQLPFMQFLMGGRPFEVLSILTGSLHEYISNGERVEEGQTRELVQSLKGVVAEHEGPCVFIAAADLAHIGAQFGDKGSLDQATMDESKRRDIELLEAVLAVDAVEFFARVKREEDRRRICGLAPIYFTLSMLDSCKGELVGYQQWTDGASSVSFAGTVFH
jgi:MEMO1 family protein